MTIVRGTLLVAALALAAGPAPADTLQPFSTMSSLDDGWAPLEFPSIKKHSQYQLVTDDGTQVIRAQSQGGASGLIARIHIEPGEKLTLHWRWKVSNIYQTGNARKKDGDDYPARIYVAFAFEPDKAGFFERVKRKAAELIYGEKLPGNALNYIWANKLPVNTVIANPFTDRTQMIAVRSGPEQAGQWVTETQDIVADYKRAFGEAPPPIVGIGIMTDADNTGESATAWYGDITLER
ncbi:DUF3047 domain-containing protein [Marinobacter halodurans]|uniref:DUF3047 domain-containing protein n=1 Tax=Marinobacter halodurans TaxID=2528979 RepID=A0ABY1ZL49_9GAMM|nr:DUF3047 domain-containing protein [Marinobacter halodurans]TBW56426.1 DUF3047 domain-containing protein [Marinobacter halodurans]